MRIMSMIGNLGTGTVIFSLAFIAPIIVGVICRESASLIFYSFFIPFTVTLVIGLAMWFLGRYEIERIRDREAFAVAGYLWLIMAFFGALPYIFSGVLPAFIDAYFESMSGFVTCGNTVITDVESIPDSMLFWRSLTQWIGGLGILVLTVVILTRILGSGLLLVKAEAPGPTVSRLRPKIRDTAKVLWSIYILFTVIGILLLWGAGMNLFDSVNHSMTALATGGFSTKNASIGHYNSPTIEGVIMVLMILGSTSFVLHYSLVQGKIRKILKNQELRFYLSLLAIFTAFITIDLTIKTEYGIGESFRYGIFQVISMNGTVGFVNTNVGPGGAVTWPNSSLFLIIVMMMIGACTGSTGGALKVARFLILLKAGRREFKKIKHRRAVIPINVGKKTADDKTVMRVAIFTFLYILIFFLAALLLLSTGLDFPSALSASASAMGNVGSGIGRAAGTYDFIHPLGKIVLILCMWLGRLEIYAAANIFFPSTYWE